MQRKHVDQLSSPPANYLTLGYYIIQHFHSFGPTVVYYVDQAQCVVKVDAEVATWTLTTSLHVCFFDDVRRYLVIYAKATVSIGPIARPKPKPTIWPQGRGLTSL